MIQKFYKIFFTILFFFQVANAYAEVTRDLIAEEESINIHLSEGEVREPRGFFERIIHIFSADKPKGNIVIYKYDQGEIVVSSKLHMIKKFQILLVLERL